MIWEIAKATGWSLHYILWKINYQTLIMMAADAVRYVEGKEKGATQKGSSAGGFFQTRLKKRKSKKKDEQ